MLPLCHVLSLVKELGLSFWIMFNALVTRHDSLTVPTMALVLTTAFILKMHLYDATKLVSPHITPGKHRTY